jgi:hypothetical protein
MKNTKQQKEEVRKLFPQILGFCAELTKTEKGKHYLNRKETQPRKRKIQSLHGA